MASGLASHPVSLTRLLRKYFRSGWAFLIPYLAAYLLYWWLKWPVNPVAGLRPPALLHVYWTLHAITALLAAIALVAWLRERRQAGDAPLPSRFVPAGDEGVAASAPPSADGIPVSGLGPEPVRHSPGDGGTFGLLTRLAPWLLLALLFWIPGVYLEWPSDPWEHYRRINEWSYLQTVGQYSASEKSSYFLAYSLIGRVTPPTRQIRWFDLYYAGCCLLLCWQYWRLARAIGVGERASMLFVLLQALLFGNNLFGFYRYYGMSSTVFSQLGAVALIRIAFEAVARTGSHQESQGSQRNPPCDPRVPSWQKEIHADLGPRSLEHARLFALGPPGLALFRFAVPCALLLTLCAFNHIQGVGIAGLGLGAVAVWRLIEWRRSMIWWLAASAIVVSVATVLWWPRNPALDAVYRPAHWLTGWYGFNLFSPDSPAFDRAMQILGVFGVINLSAGLLLLRQNHVAGWLTILPPFSLCLPFVAIPLAGALATHDLGNIIAFHRFLLAAPATLAMVSLGAILINDRLRSPPSGAQESPGGSPIVPLRPGPSLEAPRGAPAEADCSPSTAGPAPADQDPSGSAHERLHRSAGAQPGTESRPPPSHWGPSFFNCQLARRTYGQGGASALLLLVGTLASLVIVPARGPFFNRFWHALLRAPEDLVLKGAIANPVLFKPRPTKAGRPARLLTTADFGQVAGATGRTDVTCVDIRLINPQVSPPTARVRTLADALVYYVSRGDDTLLVLPAPAFTHTPVSLAAWLSGHWLPQEVALEHTGGPEMGALAREMGGQGVETATAAYYSCGDGKATVWHGE